MALVKQEYENNDMESGNAWMAYWANPETDATTVKHEEEKPSMDNLESDYDEESCDESATDDDAHVVKEEGAKTINKTKFERKETKMDQYRDAKRENKSKKSKDIWSSQSFEER